MPHPRMSPFRSMIAATAVALLFTAGGFHQASASAQPLQTGFTFWDDGVPGTAAEAKATGATMLRVVARWAVIAPQTEPQAWEPGNPADPHYNWGIVDREVVNAVEAGFTPVIMVDGAPTWAQGCNGPFKFPESICKPDPAQLAEFATAAARRYSGYFGGLPRVRYWQGLNEPNLSIYFTPQAERGKAVSPVLYRTLINAFYFAVKAVNPSNLVLAAGLGPIEVPRLTIGPLRFTRKLLCMAGGHDPHPTAGRCGGGVHFDIFDIHPYTSGGPTHKGHGNDVELGSLPKLQELLAAADKAGRIKGQFRRTPLWITEFSWDSKPPDPGGLPMPILKRWTAEALYRAWSAGVHHFFWLELRDNPPSLTLPFSESIEAGLYFRGPTIAEDRPKPNLQAFRFPFVAYTSKTGFTYWGRTGTSTPGRVTIQVREGGHWRNAGVARASGSGIFQGTVRTSYGAGRHGMVRALYRREEAVPFSLHPVRDFHQPPFGSPVG